MKQYTDLLRLVINEGEWKTNRTAQKTLSYFGHQFRFDLRQGFPLLTLKQVPFQSVIAELCGFIRGVRNAKDFVSLGTSIWNANAEAQYWLENPYNRHNGDLGRIYGVQWRQWMANNDGRTYSVIDQFQNLLDGLTSDPFGRRHIVTAWNPAELNQMALPPCHLLFQCNVSNDGYLDLHMYQRSADLFLGVPFNIASYAALTHYISDLVGLKPRSLIISMSDIHLYENQMDAAYLLLEREVGLGALPAPTLRIERDNESSIDSVVPSMFVLNGYQHHPAIKVPMVV